MKMSFPIYDFINNIEKDLRSLSYDKLQLLHIIFVLNKLSRTDTDKVFEIIKDEIYKRQQYEFKPNYYQRIKKEEGCDMNI